MALPVTPRAEARRRKSNNVRQREDIFSSGPVGAHFWAAPPEPERFELERPAFTLAEVTGVGRSGGLLCSGGRSVGRGSATAACCCRARRSRAFRPPRRPRFFLACFDLRSEPEREGEDSTDSVSELASEERLLRRVFDELTRPTSSTALMIFFSAECERLLSLSGKKFGRYFKIFLSFVTYER